MKKRIWELDALRGLNLLWMIVIHFMYDITWLFPLVRGPMPAWYDALVRLCGVLFILISGICVNLGKHTIRRGLTVLGCGMIITAVTVALALTGFCDSSIIIYFGILQCLSCCMLLWPLFRKCPGWGLILLGIVFWGVGQWMSTLTTQHIWLIPLGVVTREFASSDYFPLVLHFGIFLFGAGVGRYLYACKTTLFPRVKAYMPIRFLGWCGQNSLPIYMLHQPILAAIAAGIYYLLT